MVFPCQVKFIAAIVTEAGNLLIHSDIVIVFAPAYYKLHLSVRVLQSIIGINNLE